MLETSAGTGRNIGYYPAGVDEVVFADLNEQMLRQAKGKWESSFQDQYQHQAIFLVSDVEAMTQVPFSLLREACSTSCSTLA